MAKVPKGFKVALRSQVHASGRHLRYATVVTFPDGYEVGFVERVPKLEAVKNAVALRAREGKG